MQKNFAKQKLYYNGSNSIGFISCYTSLIFELFNPCCSSHEAFIQCCNYALLQGQPKAVTIYSLI